MQSRRARRRWRAFAVFCAVALLEVGLLFLLGRVKGREPEAPIDVRPPFEVVLYDPPPPEQPRELPSPPVQAPEPAPVVGIAPTPSPQTGFGQGGQGTGSGSGAGSGSGPGSGSTGPRLITGPTIGQIRANHPPGARTRYGRVELSCLIRLDDRLEGCRVVDESPAGLGFGEAGLRVAGYFRFEAPTEAGRPVSGQRVTVGVDFGNRPR